MIEQMVCESERSREGTMKGRTKGEMRRSRKEVNVGRKNIMAGGKRNGEWRR